MTGPRHLPGVHQGEAARGDGPTAWSCSRAGIVCVDWGETNSYCLIQAWIHGEIQRCVAADPENPAPHPPIPTSPSSAW